jgi:AraC-like DNA-binding protein
MSHLRWHGGRSARTNCLWRRRGGTVDLDQGCNRTPRHPVGSARPQAAGAGRDAIANHACHRAGRLTPSQTVRAEAFLAAHFAEDVTLNDVAAQCRLSPAQFARAFAQTTGMLPNEWLLRYRIDEAKAMMLETSLNISDIAKACGFTDKSHFTRVFMRVAGSNPGAWRRDNRPW